MRYPLTAVFTFFAALVAALALAPPALSRNGPNWYRVAQCETGGKWNWGAEHRPNEGRLYEGGVGFYYLTWRSWATTLGLISRYPHAYLAPPRIQIRVAQYGWEHGGYWGCLH